MCRKAVLLHFPILKQLVSVAQHEWHQPLSLSCGCSPLICHWYLITWNTTCYMSVALILKMETALKIIASIFYHLSRTVIPPNITLLHGTFVWCTQNDFNKGYLTKHSFMMGNDLGTVLDQSPIDSIFKSSIDFCSLAESWSGSQALADHTVPSLVIPVNHFSRRLPWWLFIKFYE